MGDYKIPFGSYMNRDKDGNWDVKESIGRYEREANAFVELQERTTSVLANAIDKQFVANPQATMNKGAIVTLALGEVKFTADTYQALKERAEEIIDEDDRFYTVKGKGGGLRRMTDEEFTAWKTEGKTPHDMERDAKKAAKGKKQKTAPVTVPVAPASK